MGTYIDCGTIFILLVARCMCLVQAEGQWGRRKGWKRFGRLPDSPDFLIAQWFGCVTVRTTPASTSNAFSCIVCRRTWR